MANRSLQDSMGQAARRRAESLSWDGVAGQLLALYHRLAATHPHPAGAPAAL